MKKQFLLLLFMAGLSSLLMAEDNQQLNEAMKNGLLKIRESLLERQSLQQQNGLTICWCTLFNPFENGEEFARKTIGEMMPLLRGNGELTVLDAARARASTNIQANQFLTETEAKTMFQKLNCDIILLGKIDKLGQFILTGIAGNGDAELVTDISFELDTEFYKLVDGYVKPFPAEATLAQLTAEINAIDYTPDGRTIIGGLQNGQVYSVDAVTKNVVSVLREEEHSCVNDLAVRKDQIFVSTNTGLLLLKGPNDEIIFDTKPSTSVVVTSATETIIAGFEGRISAFSTNGTKLMDFEGVRGPVKSLNLNPDERNVYAIDSNGAGLWSALTGKKIASVSGIYNALTVSPQGNYVALASDREITQYEMDLKKKKFTITPDDIGNAVITSLGTSNNGFLLLAGLNDGKTHSFLATTMKPIHILTGHTATVNRIRFRPGADTFATGSDDGKLGIWNSYKEPSANLAVTNQLKTSASVMINNGKIYEIAPTQTLYLTVPIGPSRADLLNPSTAIINNDSYSTTLRFEQNETKRISITASSGTIDADNRSRVVPRRLAVLDDQIFVAYTPRFPELVGRLKANLASWENGNFVQGKDDDQHQLNITGIVTTQDGYTYTVSEDCFLKVWKDGKLIKSIEHGEPIQSVDCFGNTLITTCFSEIRVWDKTKFELLQAIAITNTGPAIFDSTGSIIAIKDGYTFVRFSSDGKQQPIVFPREIDATESTITFPIEITGLKRGEQDMIMVLLSNNTIAIRNSLFLFTIPGTCAIQTEGVIIAGQADGTFQIFDSHTGKKLPSPGLPRHEKRVIDIVDIGQNRFASTGSDGALMVVDYTTGKIHLRTFFYSDGDKVAIKDGRYRGDTMHLIYRIGDTTTEVPSYVITNSKF